MSILTFAELTNGAYKRTSLEAIYYGAELAKQMDTTCSVLAIGAADQEQLTIAGKYGAHKVLHVSDDTRLNEPNIMAYAEVVGQTTIKTKSKVLISAKSSLSDPVMARVSGALRAGIVGNASSLPDLTDGFKVERSIFTGKAFASTHIHTDVKIVTIKKNAVSPVTTELLAPIEQLSLDLPDSLFSAKVTETLKQEGVVSLPEADLVVSGGRGLKGPEHWQPLLDLAEALGATTACSKPVSDLDWRPHHEHVGQTGVKISPNLYIACGISGAIQHLAGVNNSKVIVVINTDPDAPFFKAADYGIIGDAFEVLPKLTAAIKAL